jgi:hypothetical protein
VLDFNAEMSKEEKWSSRLAAGAVCSGEASDGGGLCVVELGSYDLLGLFAVYIHGRLQMGL